MTWVRVEWVVVLSIAQRLQNAVAHLRRSLSRERDCQHLFRLFRVRQQAEKSLHQQLRLPGAGGRLYDPRLLDVECIGARGGISRLEFCRHFFFSLFKAGTSGRAYFHSAYSPRLSSCSSCATSPAEVSWIRQKIDWPQRLQV